MTYMSDLFSRIPNDSFDARPITRPVSNILRTGDVIAGAGIRAKKVPKPGDGFGNFREVP
jgi:hypothetical protein